jgi:hypothetical protein
MDQQSGCRNYLEDPLTDARDHCSQVGSEACRTQEDAAGSSRFASMAATTKGVWSRRLQTPGHVEPRPLGLTVGSKARPDAENQPKADALDRHITVARERD